MCVGCGGTCRGPRFTQEPGPADMVVIGTNIGPTHQPSHLIRQHPGDVVSYERLFTNLTPDNQAATYVHPGTFGRTFAAGRGR